MDAAVDDPGSALASDAPDFVSAKGVAGMDADADDVAGLDGFGGDLFEGFVDEDGISCGRRCGCGENEEPTRGNYGGPKRVIAGIYEMDTQESTLLGVERRFTECLIVERISRPSCGWVLSAGQEYPCRAMLSIIQS